MGYYIFSFGIDSNKAAGVFGSKDEALFNDIIETEMFETYSSQDFPCSVSTRHALEHIVFGKEMIASSAHSYWYAFIAICAYIGEPLEGTHEIKLGYETDLINQYLAEDFGKNIVIEDVLLTGPDSFGLPQPDDWPLSGLLNREALLSLNAQLAGINITDEILEELLEEDEEKEMAYDSIRQIKENVSFCLSNNLDMISFCH